MLSGAQTCSVSPVSIGWAVGLWERVIRRALADKMAVIWLSALTRSRLFSTKLPSNRDDDRARVTVVFLSRDRIAPPAARLTTVSLAMTQWIPAENVNKNGHRAEHHVLRAASLARVSRGSAWSRGGTQILRTTDTRIKFKYVDSLYTAEGGGGR